MAQLILDLTLIQPGDWVLTPNRRLAAWLQRDYNQQQQAAGRSAWNGLQAMPLDVWLAEQYNIQSIIVGRNLPLLLSAVQTRVLWQQQLEQIMPVGSDVDGMVQLSIQARNLICRWQLQPAHWDTGDTEEIQVFAAAHRAYCEELASNQWIDQAALPGLLLKDLPHCWKTSGRVFLHGFNDASEPQLQAVVAAFASAGTEVNFTHQQRFQSQSGTLAFADIQLQFRAALTWALEQQQSLPAGRIGVVVPNLQNQRQQLEKICQDLAAANPQYLDGHWHSKINITAGQPLDQYSLISHLLLLLRGLFSALKLGEWDVLLKSPFFTAGVAEFEIRDQFVIWLRDQNRHQLSPAQLNTQWQNFHRAHKREQQDPLFPLPKSLSDAMRESHTIQEWVRWLRQVQTSLGWLQQRSLDSTGYQVAQRLQDILQSLPELDSVLETSSYADFVHQLGLQLSNTSFQPQTETAPIQVMGTLEAAAMNFDRLWVCECESQQWPQPANPNALLPRSTLRQFNMPGSGPERELEYARNMLNGFLQAAPQVIFSWGEFQGDAQLMLSPILADVAVMAPRLPQLRTDSREQLVHEHAGLIESGETDDCGAPLSAQHSKGGSGVIKAQSLCPFKAYAEYRLGVRAADDLQDGVKASDRGSLVHRVLETFWREVVDYQHLVQLLEQEVALDQTLNRIVDIELERFKLETYLQPEALYQLERQRTLNTVRQWLNNSERSRTNFTVATVEKRQTITLADLQLSVTVDRIDVLPDGSKVIIDYKTGSKNKSSLLGERPEEPQLPLYALLDLDNTKGIVFGIVKPDQQEWQGFRSEHCELESQSSRKVDAPANGWDEQLAEWRNNLERLATEFRQGQAQVAPLNENTCTYCHLSPLCRIKEQNRDSE